MKTVGIFLRELEMKVKVSDTNVEIYGVHQDLVWFLRKYDVNVIAIPMFSGINDDAELERIKPIIDMCDGLIFPGGPNTTLLDLKVVKYLYEIDKPTLGICLGMQAFAKAFNGNKICEVGSTKHLSNDEYVHSVKVDENSLLYKILGANNIMVNSRHMLQITDTNFDVVAYSDDGIVEALEDKNKKFFLGVQWHPETLLDDEYSQKIFDYFISKL